MKARTSAGIIRNHYGLTRALTDGEIRGEYANLYRKRDAGTLDDSQEHLFAALSLADDAARYQPDRYSVIVGNIGTVYSAYDKTEAVKTYADYVQQSASGYGRAAGEPVTLMIGNEILCEALGTREE